MVDVLPAWRATGLIILPGGKQDAVLLQAALAAFKDMEDIFGGQYNTTCAISYMVPPNNTAWIYGATYNTATKNYLVIWCHI